MACRMISPSQKPILEVKGLCIALPGGGDRANAVEQVSFGVGAGETRRDRPGIVARLVPFEMVDRFASVAVNVHIEVQFKGSSQLFEDRLQPGRHLRQGPSVQTASVH